MNLFDVYSLSHILHKFTQIEFACMQHKMFNRGGQLVDHQVTQRWEEAVSEAEMLFKQVEFQDCLTDIANAKHSWERPLVDYSAACEIVHNLQVDIISALNGRFFLRVPDDRAKFVPHYYKEQPIWGIRSVFGEATIQAFPSSFDDIIQAGECLAADCNTAAVYHLMRAVEVALRAIAVDRGATFPNKPLDQQEWGVVIEKVESIVKEMRGKDAKLWKDAKFKEAQVRFYHEAMKEFRSFNEVWRKHLSHADISAFYDHNQASSVLEHVVKFMQLLATRISETKLMPEFWETE